MSEPHSRIHRLSRAALIVAVVLAAYLVVRGYAFSVSDQNEYLPRLYRMLDAGYLRHDWFTNETAGLNPRTYFIAVAAGFSWFIGDVGAHFVLWAALFVAIGLGCIRLGARLFGSRAAGVIGWVFVLFGARATLGEQALVGNYLQQSMFGAAGVVWALALFFERRWWAGWLLVGLATALHVTTGIIGAVLLGVLTLLRLKEIGAKQLAFSALAFLVPALVATVPLLVSLRSQSVALSDAEFIKILARVRAPWHYLPSSFPLWEDYGRFVVLVAAGALALRLQPPSLHRRGLYASAIAVGVLAAMAYVFVELVPSATITSLDLTRATVYLRLLAMLALGGAVARGLQQRAWDDVLPACAVALGVVTHADVVVLLVLVAWLVAARVPKVAPVVSALSAAFAGIVVVVALVTLARPAWGKAISNRVLDSRILLGQGAALAAVALAVYVLWQRGGDAWRGRLARWAPALWLFPAAVVVLVAVDGPLKQRFPGVHELTVARVHLGRVYADELDEMAAWCRDNTPEDAVLIIPPGSPKHDVADFRVKARRAIVADFKAITFTRAGLREWRERLRDLTNDAAFAPGGDRAKECAEGYASLTAEDFRGLADKYGATYVLVEKPHALPFPVVHETRSLRLYGTE